MKVLIFGATGMVGQGVLRECLVHAGIGRVVTLGRSATGVVNPKLHEIVQPDLFHYNAIEDELTGFDACFFCLGVSSSGMAEEQYHRLTYQLTVAAAETLARLNPRMTFIYVSGAGTDSTEQGKVMWARVKGKTENTLLQLPFHAVYIFRPAGIQPMNGEQSKTPAYRLAYKIAKPLLPLLRRLLPQYISTTEEIGRAMIHIARQGAPKKILESSDISQFSTLR